MFENALSAPNISKRNWIILISAAILLVVLTVGGYLLWNNYKKLKAQEALDNAKGTAEKIIEDAIKGTLPSFGTNPLEGKPNINPADSGNPIKNIKTNPFE